VGAAIIIGGLMTITSLSFVSLCDGKAALLTMAEFAAATVGTNSLSKVTLELEVEDAL
jgi:hypothetical protein